MQKSAKRQRFEKVATKRVQRVIDTLQLIQNCSNRNNYEYDQKDVEKMFSEMTRAFKDARAAFNSEVSKSQKEVFSFDD